MRDRPDFSVVLGVEPSSATLVEIQAAYRQRVQVIHPDRFDRTRMPEAWAHDELNASELWLGAPLLSCGLSFKTGLSNVRHGR
jgi:hypothetical protein